MNRKLFTFAIVAALIAALIAAPAAFASSPSTKTVTLKPGQNTVNLTLNSTTKPAPKIVAAAARCTEFQAVNPTSALTRRYCAAAKAQRQAARNKG